MYVNFMIVIYDFKYLKGCYDRIFDRFLRGCGEFQEKNVVGLRFNFELSFKLFIGKEQFVFKVRVFFIIEVFN